MLLSPDEPAGRLTFGAVSEPEPFTRLLTHLASYKAWLASGALIGLLTSGVVLCFVTPRYQAEAVVIVDRGRGGNASSEPLARAAEPPAPASESVDALAASIKSELQVLLAPELARHVISELGLLRQPEYRPALTHVSTASRFASLRGSLSDSLTGVLAVLGFASVAPAHSAVPAAPVNLATAVASPGLAQAGLAQAGPATAEPVDEAAMQNAIRLFSKSFWALNDPRSRTIRLGYRSESPELAASVTNAALRRYLAADEADKAASMDRSEDWLKQRITRLRADLDAAERAVEAYRAAHDSGLAGREYAPLKQQLATLQARAETARADLAAATAKVANNRRSDAKALAASPDVLGSRLMVGLRQQEAALLSEQARLSVSLEPANPALIRLASQLAKVRGTIRTEIDRIVRSTATEQRLAELRLNELTEQIQSVQARLNAAGGAESRLPSLEAEVTAKRAVLDQFLRRYEENAGAPVSPPDGRVVSWASIPVDETSPQYGMSLAGGTLGGLFLGFCASLARERRRRGFSRIAELEDELGLVVAGLTPALKRRALSTQEVRRSGDPAAMRELALSVRALAHTPRAARSYRTILVTSSVAGEGKSTAALSLARSVANAGQSCLLIDGDIRNPSLHRTLGLPATPGLVELTLDRAPLEAVIRPVEGETFAFLPAGRQTPDTLSPFTSELFGRALPELKRQYDVVIFDSAPVLLAAEGLVLAGLADLTVFVVKWRTTPREIVQKSTAMLTRGSAGPVLAVLSQVDLKDMRRRFSPGVEDQYRRAYQLS